MQNKVSLTIKHSSEKLLLKHFKQTFYYTCQACFNDHLYKTTSHLRRPTSDLSKKCIVNLANIPLERFELSYKRSKYFEVKSNFWFFSFYCFALNSSSFYLLLPHKSLDSLCCEVQKDNLNATLSVGLTLH